MRKTLYVLVICSLLFAGTSVHARGGENGDGDRENRIEERESKLEEKRAEREAKLAEKKAELEAKQAEREAKMEEKKEEIEAKIAERGERVEERTAKLELKMEERQAKMEERVVEREIKIEERKTKIEERFEKMKTNIAERKAKFDEKQKERVEKLFNKIFATFDHVAEKLANIDARITAKLTALAARGVDTTEADAKLEIAKDSLNATLAELASIKSTLSGAVDDEMSKEFAKELIQGAKASLKSTHEAYRAVLVSVKTFDDGVEDEVEVENEFEVEHGPETETEHAAEVENEVEAEVENAQ